MTSSVWNGRFFGDMSIFAVVSEMYLVYMSLFHWISKCASFSQGHELTALSLERERERENLCKFERPQKMIKSLQSDVTGRIIATLTGPNLTPKGSLVWILFQSGLLIWFQIERFSIHFCSENVGACTDPWIPCRLVACWRKVWICPSTCPRWELVLIYKGFENLEVFFVVSDG